MNADISSAPLSAKWLNITCPYASWTHESGTDNTPSFGVQINKTGVSRFWCFSCQRGAPGLGELLMELKALGCAINFKELNELAAAEFDGAEFSFDDDEEDAGNLLFPFPEDWLESFPLAVNSGPALVYMQSRGFSANVLAQLKLRYDPFEKRVSFPIRGEDKVLYGLHGRDITDQNPLRYFAYGHKKRRNPHVLLGEDTIDWTKKVVLAEGPMDWARTKQVYRNVLSPLHASISEYMLERLVPAFEIVTLFDPDKAGDLGRKKIRKWAGSKRIVEHCYLPDGKDAAKHTPEELADLLSEFVVLDPVMQ
jgi:hypothetical protein